MYISALNSFVFFASLAGLISEFALGHDVLATSAIEDKTGPVKTSLSSSTRPKKESFRGYLAFMLLCEPDSYCITIETKAAIVKCLETGQSQAALYLYKQCTAQGSVFCDDSAMTRTIKSCLRLQGGTGNLINDASRQCIREQVTLGHLDCYKINAKLRIRGQQFWGRPTKLNTPSPPENLASFLFTTTTTTGAPPYPFFPQQNFGLPASIGSQGNPISYGQQQAQQFPPRQLFYPSSNGQNANSGGSNGHQIPQLPIYPYYPAVPGYELPQRAVGYPPLPAPERDHPNHRRRDIEYGDYGDQDDYDDDYGDDHEPPRRPGQRRATRAPNRRRGRSTTPRSSRHASGARKRPVIYYTRRPKTTTTTTTSNITPTEAPGGEGAGSEYSEAAYDEN